MLGQALGAGRRAGGRRAGSPADETTCSHVVPLMQIYKRDPHGCPAIPPVQACLLAQAVTCACLWFANPYQNSQAPRRQEVQDPETWQDVALCVGAGPTPSANCS